MRRPFNNNKQNTFFVIYFFWSRHFWLYELHVIALMAVKVPFVQQESRTPIETLLRKTTSSHRKPNGYIKRYQQPHARYAYTE